MSQFNEATGYDQEEAEFKRREVEALAALRAKLDAQRAELKASAKRPANWMYCPKCGGQLAETRKGDVMVDTCAGCGGVFLDKGELELLLSQSKGTMLGRLFGQ
jgi:NADH pyrophosphatase NudC (nudix superfamily)